MQMSATRKPASFLARTHNTLAQKLVHAAKHHIDAIHRESHRHIISSDHPLLPYGAIHRHDSRHLRVASLILTLARSLTYDERTEQDIETAQAHLHAAVTTHGRQRTMQTNSALRVLTALTAE